MPGTGSSPLISRPRHQLVRAVIGALLATCWSAESARAQTAASSPGAIDIPIRVRDVRDASALLDAPMLVDHLQRPKNASTGSRLKCSNAGLRTAPDLGAIDEGKQPLLGLLRNWGQRHMRFADEPRGCIDWAAVVSAWQQTTGARVTGVLDAADLNRLNDARMTGFPAYRTALANWQKERAEAAMKLPTVRLEPPPPKLMTPVNDDVLKDLGNAPQRVAKVSDHLLTRECALTEGAEGAKFCKAVLDSGRLKDRKDIAIIHITLAGYYEFSSDQYRAFQHYTWSIDNNISPSALAIRAMYYSGSGYYNRALADIDAAIAIQQSEQTPNPKVLASSYEIRAKAFSRSGNIPAARKDYDEALRIDPNNLAALEGRRALGKQP